MKIEFRFADESQEATMVQMAEIVPRIGETVQIAIDPQTQVVWKVYDVIHYLTETNSYGRTTVFLNKQDAST